MTSIQQPWLIVNHRLIIPASWIEAIDSSLHSEQINGEKSGFEHPKSQTQNVYQVLSLFTEINYLEKQGLMQLSTTGLTEIKKMFQNSCSAQKVNDLYMSKKHVASF